MLCACVELSLPAPHDPGGGAFAFPSRPRLSAIRSSQLAGLEPGVMAVVVRNPPPDCCLPALGACCRLHGRFTAWLLLRRSPMGLGT